MKVRSLKAILSSFLALLVLTGFDGHQRYVELNGRYNGRSSANFYTHETNTLSVLARGTRGEVLEYRKLTSGNYGLRIKVLNGPHSGRVFWIYHRPRSSSVTLFTEAPPAWGSHSTRQTSSVEEAHGMEAVTDVNAKPAPSQDLVDIVNDSNEKMSSLQKPPCNNCSYQPVEGLDSLLRPATRRPVAKACSKLVSPTGTLGPQGQTLYETMAAPQYAPYYTARNALGDFCPKFNKLTTSEKLYAWTWFWTALAHEESSCDMTKEHKTTFRDRRGRLRVLNPHEGYGLWALERDRNIRRWRGAACSNISSVSGQAHCAIDIMVNTQLKRGRTAAVRGGGYWGPIHRGKTQLMPHMRRLAICF